MTRLVDVRIPVIILSGFLGSGKTTLLNALLKPADAPRTAVIINEFGEISLDHLLVREVSEARVVLKNGCVCCAIRGDLRAALRELIDDSFGAPPFERIVIETTGLADPGPIAQTIGTDPMLRRQTRLAGIIATVDAIHGGYQLAEHPECLQQVAVADHLLLTKTDLADEGAVAMLTDRLRKVNAEAPILDKAALPDGLEPVMGRLTREARSRSWITCTPGVISHDGIESIHIEADRPIDWTAFAVWLSAFVHHYADRVLRIKGLLAVPGLPAPLVLHVIRNHIHPPEHLDDWPDENRNSRIVFIVRDIDTRVIKRSLLDFLGHRGPAENATAAALERGELQPA